MIDNETHSLKIIKRKNYNREDKIWIETCLSKHYFMNSWNYLDRLEIVKQMSWYYLSKDTVLFKQGMVGNNFYILKSGTVEWAINNVAIKQMKKGESFGELALLHGVPRSGTIMAITDCYLWVLDRNSFQQIIEHISFVQFDDNKRFIDSIPLLNTLEINQKRIWYLGWYKETFEQGTRIIKENDQSNCWYIIKDGEIECSDKNSTIRILKNGDYFGERGILMNAPRSCDVTARMRSVCYSISLSTFRCLFGDHFRELMFIMFLKNSIVSSKIVSKIKHKLITDNVLRLFKLKKFERNQMVLNKGYDKASKFMVLVDGNIVKESNIKDVVAYKGSILFENEIMNNIHTITTFKVLANPDCLIAEADIGEITEVIGCNLINWINKKTIIDKLSTLNILAGLSLRDINRWCQKIKIMTVNKDELLLGYGNISNNWYIIKSGKIEITDQVENVVTYGPGDSICEKALWFEEENVDTIVVKEDSDLFYLERKDFMEWINKNMINYLRNNSWFKDNVLTFEEFQYEAIIGKGETNFVFLISSIKTHIKYSIKLIHINEKTAEHYKGNQYKDSWIDWSFPFIVKFVKFFYTKNWFYAIMENIQGKTLFNVLRDIGLLNKAQTKFYCGSIFLALNYWHEKKMIHRNIAPENIWVQMNGFIKWINFSRAKIWDNKTNTICGVPHYWAPEIIIGEGYYFRIDFWAAAIIMYECVCGYVPFGEKANNPIEIYWEIWNENLTFPDYCKDSAFQDLVTRMLLKNPMERISELCQIKGHQWFNDFDWDNLISLNCQIPLIPKVRPVKTAQKQVLLKDFVKQNIKFPRGMKQK